MQGMKPLEYVQLTSAAADQMTGLFSIGSTVRLDLGGLACILMLHPDFPSVSCNLELAFQAGDRQGACRIAGGDLSGWLASQFGGDISAELIDKLPPPLLATALSVALEAPLQALERQIGRKLELLEARRLEPEASSETPSGCWRLPFELACGDSPRIAGEMLLSEDGGELVRILSGMLEEQQGLELDSLPFALGVMVGKVALDVATYHNLEAGDVLLPDVYYPLRDSQVMLTLAGEGFFLGRLTQTTIELLEPVMTDSDYELTEQDGAPDSENAEPSGEAVDTEGGSADLGALPVVLTFELDSQRISLEQLRKLKPGMVVRTRKGLDAPVTIKANGSPVARGTLVDIDGRVAVRILKTN